MRLLLLSGGLVAGVALGLTAAVPWPSAALFLAASLLGALLLQARGRSPLPALALAALCAGLLRASLTAAGPNDLQTFVGQPRITLEGIVATDPEPAGTALRFRLDATRVKRNDAWREVKAAVQVTARPPPNLAGRPEPPFLRYGDLLALEGTLEAPPDLEGFDYREYLARQGIHSVMAFPTVKEVTPGHGNTIRQALFGLRHRLSRSLASSIPEPQASVDQAMLLGLRSSLPADVEEAFRSTGTSHLLAVSGLHVGIILGMAVALSRALLGRRRGWYLLLPLASIWVYALLTGFAPPVQRAAVMGSLYLWALYLGRQNSALPAIGAAAALMVGLQPAVLWSVSFQLSFAAVAGLAVLAPPFQGRLEHLARLRIEATGFARRLYHSAVEMAAISLAAIVATLPLVALYFSQVSLVGLPTSILAIPAMPLVLLTSLLAAALELVHPLAGQAMGWLAWLSTAYLTWVIRAFASLPGAAVSTGAFGGIAVALYYAALAGATWLLLGGPWPRYLALRWREGIPAALGHLPPLPPPRWLLPPLGAMAAVVWFIALSMPDDRLEVAFLDVGQGDAILIRSPAGGQILVDGGPHPQAVVQTLGRRLPPWDRDLDLVVLTHPHSDHVAGLAEVLRRYGVGMVLEGPSRADTPEYREWRTAADESGARLIQAEAGQELRLGDLRLRVLNPPSPPLAGTSSDPDNASVVLLVSYGNIDFLLTGEIFTEAEHFLLARNGVPQAEVLKVAHHGSDSSSAPDFLDAVAPAVAVISAGRDNRFGHPDSEVVARLSARVAPGQVFTTAQNGAITLSTDGQSLWVATER